MKKDWKGCPPRISDICIINDDKNEAYVIGEKIQREFPKLKRVRYGSSIFDAYYSIGRFDYVIIDISAVAPLMMGDIQHAYGSIVKFMENYPLTEIIITSGVGRECAEEVIEQIKKESGRPEMVHYGGKDWEALKIKLYELIKPIDLEWTKIKKKK